jgi:hypothetical protein
MHDLDFCFSVDYVHPQALTLELFCYITYNFFLPSYCITYVLMKSSHIECNKLGSI